MLGDEATLEFAFLIIAARADRARFAARKLSDKDPP